MSNTQRIICICSGNICRSPMATAMLRHKLPRRDISAMVISGGTLGLQGRRAAEFARRAIAERSEDMADDIEQHRSQGLSAPMIKRADHLLVMAPKHEETIRRIAPQSVDRIVRLWEYADDTTLGKIPDPVGHDATVFRGCRDLIERCVDNWLDDHFGNP